MKGFMDEQDFQEIQQRFDVAEGRIAALEKQTAELIEELKKKFANKPEKK